MDLKKQKDEKVGVIEDVLNKFKYSFQGIAYCFKNETSFIFQGIGLVAVTVLGIIFKISFVEWIFGIVSLFAIMEIELLNTAIEKTVDLETNKFHPLAKVAKDCGSASTCIATFISLIINLMIFIPYIFK